MVPSTERKRQVPQISCPHCDRGLGPAAARRVSIGRPFHDCPGCGGLVPRPPFEEWMGMDARTKLELVGRGGLLAGSFGLLPALVRGLVGLATQSPPGNEVLAAWALGGLALAGSVWLWLLMQTLQGSTRRMSDPMYQARLAEFQMGKGASRSRGSTGTEPPRP